MSNFLHPHSPIGLDIGNYSVKIAKIKKGPFTKKPSLCFSAAMINADRARQSIIDAIRKASASLTLDSKKVNFSIAGPQVIMRYILLPFMSEKDLSKSLEFELEKYIPYKKEEAIINCHILAKMPNNQMIVLLVAAERKIVQEKIEIIKEAGLEPQLITVDSLALCEAFKAISPRQKGVVALIDIGYRLAKLVVLENNIPFFSRDIEVGEYDIVQMISEKMNIGYPSAQELVYEPQGKTQELIEAAKTELHSLLNELSLSFEYCERNLEKTVGQLYICGGGSKIKIISEFLGKIPSVTISPLDIAHAFSVSSPEDIHSSLEYASFLAVAAGLALS